MARSISRVILGCCLLSLAAAAGCQRGPTWDLAPVEGTVTKNGRPLANLQVVFLAEPGAGPVGPRASGITDEAGRYRLRTDNGDDGTVIGKHRVMVLDLAVRGLEHAARGSQSKEAELLPPEDVERLKEQRKTTKVPRSYGRFDETPLRAEVGREPLVFDIVIP